MTRLTISKARLDFADILNRVAYGGERIVLQRRGNDVAAIIPMRELELLEKIVQEAEDRADRAEIRKAKREMARQGTVPWTRVKKDLGL
jgi:prevent-host-death family protein